VGFEHALSRGRIFGEQVCRTARPHGKLTAAIGADAPELGGDAIDAKRAFKGTDTRIGRLIGQIPVAAFAIGADLKHVGDSRFEWNTGMLKKNP